MAIEYISVARFGQAGSPRLDGGPRIWACWRKRIGWKLKLAERLARCIADLRSSVRVRHSFVEMIRLRVLLIAAGDPNGNDYDALRVDSAFKMAVGRLPETAAGLCSQPTMSRLKNLHAPTPFKRMMMARITPEFRQGYFASGFKASVKLS